MLSSSPRLPRESVLEAPRGPETVAFFDLDQTVIGGWSILPFARDVARTRAPQPEFRPALALLRAAALDDRAADPASRRFAIALRLAAEALAGRPERWLRELGHRCYRNDLRHLVVPEMRELIALHRACGHRLVLASAATRFQVEAVAEDLAIEHVLCSELEVRRGRFTGALASPPCWGEGKLARAREFARERGAHLSRSFFYSDGLEDIPLLSAVGQPVVVNPGDPLLAVARERAWPVMQLNSHAMLPSWV